MPDKYNVSSTAHEPDNPFAGKSNSRFQTAMPQGGEAGQVLTKNSGQENDASWKNPKGSGGLAQLDSWNLGDSEASMWDTWDEIAAALNAHSVQPSDIAFIRIRNTGETFSHNPGGTGNTVQFFGENSIGFSSFSPIFTIGAGGFTDFILRDIWTDERSAYNWATSMPPFALKNYSAQMFTLSFSYRRRLYLFPDASHVGGNGFRGISIVSQQSEPLPFTPNGNIWLEVWLSSKQQKEDNVQ
jgi:hypothetical protein